MNPKRKRLHDQGDVVLLDFPGAQITKRRPAAVLSCVRYHSERPDAIVGLITGKLQRANNATDYLLEDWKQAGLTQPSAYFEYAVRSARVVTDSMLPNLTK